VFLRRFIAIIVAKIAYWASVKLFKRQGVTWAGKLALDICPSILKDLSSQIRNDIFIVCGTNGKTTTNNLLALGLEYEGYKIICNNTGSNMLNGVTAAFVLASDFRGRIDCDYACIEVDEASTRRILPHFTPDYMVLTNLFRDQLDRYGEIDITMEILREVLNACPNMKLIVNGDDALCAYLAAAENNEMITYGIPKQVGDSKEMNEIREGRFCKKCGAILNYSFYHYSQLGDYRCSACDFKRPFLDFTADEIESRDLDSGLSFYLREYPSHSGTTFSTGFRGLYNVYNILAAYSAIRTSGVCPSNFQNMLNSYKPNNGRMETFQIGEAKVTLNLAKNPAGFNQNIQAVMQDTKPKDIIIVINDNAQDGTDISWLWDVDFDRLSEVNANNIITSGIRYLDMGLRLKYVDIKAKPVREVRAAIDELLRAGSTNLYVLVNYTALYTTGQLLKAMTK
jgi:UDP-N-acetylmuramyl tripeptide synthase